MIEEYFKIAFRSINQRRIRSLLTVLGIFLGIVTIFVLLSLSLGLREYVNEQFENLGSDKFFIQPKGQTGGPGSTGGAVELTTEDLEVVRDVNGVDLATYFNIGNTKIEFRDQTRYYLTIGIPTENPREIDIIFEASGIEIEEGRMIRDNDNKKVLVGYNYKYRNLFDKPVKPGNTIKLNDIEFEVIGVLEAIGNPSDDQQVYIKIDDFRELFDSGEKVDFIWAQVKKGENLTEIAEEAERDLMRHRDVDEKTLDFTIQTPEELLEIFGAVLNGITGFLVIIGLISAIVGGIGIANTMYTSVLERQKEIGTMKAIGAKNSDILWIFVIEAGILGLVGGVFGVFFGIIMAKSIEYIITFYVGLNLLRASLNPLLIIGCIAFGFIIGSISGLIPSYQASKLKPVDTLRYE